MVKILSIDGGGIRGIIPAAIIAEIEKQTGKPACKLFDLIVGSSTGGIITAMLAAPDSQGNPKYSAQQIKSCYIELGKSVFHSSLIRRIFTLNGILNTRYPAHRLKKHTRDYFGNTRLHSALTDIVLSAYDTETATPWFFKSRHAAAHRNDIDDPLLAQAVRATSAAPTFFPPVKIGNHSFIDGGIVANNPALCAYAEARNLYPHEGEFLIVSLGTGSGLKILSYKKTRNWGALNWALPMLDVLSNSAAGTVDYQMRSLVGTQRYFRFEFRLDRKSQQMDDSSKENIKRLEAVAQSEIRRNWGKIMRICELLNRS
ncbi:MAG TPA: patatin [Ruminococcaceae bacterium]|mgnify:CR=1 FL=1|jgi:patatin-like phospholipase/acyl hydrolase|nr:patatin [Oscillospiraceae bacterium]